MTDSAWIAVEPRQLPKNAILAFPVMSDSGRQKQLALMPGSVVTETSALLQQGDPLYVAKANLPHLAFYQHPSYWHHLKQDDFDHFVMDYLNSLLFRIFFFKKVDHYTFIALYDFVDRFRGAWKQNMLSEFQRLIATPSSWHVAFRFRVYSALGVMLLAHRMGYEGFYDLIDFFLGALLSDIGHFKSFDAPQAFFAADPHQWFFDKHHPEMSLKMVSTIEDMPRAVLMMIAHHHEAIDGSGFPKGLKGSVDIPDQAQMVGILSEFMFGIYFGLSGSRNQAEEGTVQSAKNFLLKQRQRYSPDIYSAFTELSGNLFG